MHEIEVFFEVQSDRDPFGAGAYTVTRRCSECGRFVREVRPVWGPIQSSGPDHEACARCKPELFEEG